MYPPGASDPFLVALRDSYACLSDESTIYESFLVAERAQGPWVWCEGDDQPFLDLVCGFSSVNFGHLHPVVIKAVRRAARTLDHAHALHTRAKLELAKLLVEELATDEPYNVYFDIGGAGAVEAALRLARASTGRSTVVSFEGSFHGVTPGAAAVSDTRLLNPHGYGTCLPSSDVVQVPYPSLNSGRTSADCARALESVLVETRPAAVIIEPVQGAAGFLIPPADFLTTVRDMTRRYDVLLIADEIQVGLGRLGRFYGFPNHSGAPDVVLLSKSLAGGVYPLSAVIARADLFPRVNPASRAFFQATFSNSPFGCRIALDLLTWARREGIFEAARKKGEQLLQGLAPLAEHSFIEELQGLGCAISFKTTDDPTSGMMSDEVAGTFVSLALDEHVLLYRAGTQGNRIKIAPPLTMTEADIDVISDRLRVIADRCTNVLKRRALSQ